ncbi:hypothetical protein [Hymenobacter negativus]|uniref:Uncharacterized protein n=1 Tax=Hymenobacter negativus TaxID=2795026 RepID=A0ABS3QHY7_9BACT|nr:hypothetical protein [Hymenobacter negativus]MBO2010777.1 hypothetical protein [Hymenobacter negativus]
MPTPEQNPTDPRPDMANSAASTPSQESENDATVNATPDTAPDEQASTGTTIPSSTQQNMGDGAGIRGDYGDASQTNGLEGGPDTPDQPLTDTELTGS